MHDDDLISLHLTRCTDGDNATADGGDGRKSECILMVNTNWQKLLLATKMPIRKTSQYIRYIKLLKENNVENFPSMLSMLQNKKFFYNIIIPATRRMAAVEFFLFISFCISFPGDFNSIGHCRKVIRKLIEALKCNGELQCCVATCVSSSR